MLHFSCDLCGQQLNDRRFVVRAEVFPVFDPEEIGEDDLDVDNLQEVAQVIEEMESTGESKLDDIEPKSFRFDLCPECQQKFIKDPLNREAASRLNFSEN
jgi:hypothetical protein